VEDVTSASARGFRVVCNLRGFVHPRKIATAALRVKRIRGTSFSLASVLAWLKDQTVNWLLRSSGRRCTVKAPCSYFTSSTPAGSSPYIMTRQLNLLQQPRRSFRAFCSSSLWRAKLGISSYLGTLRLKTFQIWIQWKL